MTSGIGWSWDDLQAAAPADAKTMRLPRNGWAAQLALLAGPEHVATVPEVVPDPTAAEPAAERRDDAPSSGAAPDGSDDATGADEAMNAYLESIGLPPAPGGVEWVLVLPEGVTERDVNRATHAAQERTIDRPLLQSTAVERALRRVLDRAS